MRTRSGFGVTIVAAFAFLPAFAVLPGGHSASQPFFSDSLGIQFHTSLSQLAAAPDSFLREGLAANLVEEVRRSGRVAIEDSTVHFLYYGTARRVGVPSDLNGWNPLADTMTRLPGTQLFHLRKTLHPAARFEYKLVVDSLWVLDPLNPLRAEGGYGPNSEIRMPFYDPPTEIEQRHDIPHGRIDTLSITSNSLHRTHPLFVYLPAGYENTAHAAYPWIVVTDGGEYISLGRMVHVLDNLIADKRIVPVIAAFIDPRTDLHNAQSSMRLRDYAMSDTFVLFLVEELRKRMLDQYRINPAPAQTAIMGASLGGLIATYAALTRPDVFGLSAAQSPAYWWDNDSIITIAASRPRKNVKFYIDTGTMRDAQEKASMMHSVLKKKGYTTRYEEHPEGHNWVNWRARISHILEFFWGERK
jgi:enterochelin esterase-like enzyme